jgi:hypothetical protein
MRARKSVGREFCVLSAERQFFQRILMGLQVQKGASGFDSLLIGFQESGAIAAPAYMRFKGGGYSGIEIGCQVVSDKFSLVFAG